MYVLDNKNPAFDLKNCALRLNRFSFPKNLPLVQIETYCEMSSLPVSVAKCLKIMNRHV